MLPVAAHRYADYASGWSLLSLLIVMLVMLDRYDYELDVLRCRTTESARLFLSAYVHAWNGLPDVFESGSLGGFKGPVNSGLLS